MKLVTMKCPNCGANAEIEEGSNKTFCPYCGTQLMLDDEALRINITEKYIDEADVRRADLERQKYEHQYQRQMNKEQELKEKTAQWNKYLVIYLGVLAVSMFLMTLASGVFGKLISGIFTVALIFGGIGLYMLRPVKNENKKPIYYTNTSDKSKLTAFVLCLFCGLFGLHQFYVGNAKKGIIYFLTFGLFLFGWIADMFMIVFNNFKDSNGRVLR